MRRIPRALVVVLLIITAGVACRTRKAAHTVPTSSPVDSSASGSLNLSETEIAEGKKVRVLIADLVSLSNSDPRQLRISLKRNAEAVEILQKYLGTPEHLKKITQIPLPQNLEDILRQGAGFVAGQPVPFSVERYNQFLDTSFIECCATGLQSRMRGYLRDLKFSSFFSLEAAAGGKAVFNTDGLPTQVATMVKTIAQDYFDNVDVDIKARVIAAELMLSPVEGMAKKVSTAVVNAGPMYIKLIQTFGGKATNPELVAAFEAAKSGIPPVPIEYAYEVFNERTVDYPELAGSNLKHLASASMGSVYLITTPAGQQYPAKILRPEIEAGLKKDYDVFTKILHGQETAIGLMGEAYHANLDEADLFAEFSGVVAAHSVYAGSDRIHVVDLPFKKSTAKNFLIMSLAPGKPLNKIPLDQNTEKRLETMMDYYAMWNAAAIDGQRFHPDPHGGNAFGEMRADGKFHITIIDLGGFNEAKMNPDEVAFVSKFGLGLQFNWETRVFDALSSLNGDRAVIDAMQSDIRAIMGQADLELANKASKIIELMMANDVKLTSGIIRYFAANARLSDQISALSNALPEAKRVTSNQVFLKTLNQMISQKFRIAPANYDAVFQRPELNRPRPVVHPELDRSGSMWIEMDELLPNGRLKIP